MDAALYVVSTPIGNLGDITPRAAATLADADFVAAEDTRVTLKLLTHLGVKKQLVSYNQHNAAQREEMILARIAEGEACALCTDAGTPAISDPGERLVAAALARGLRVVPVPGPSAVVAALSVSGQLTGRFVFEGFLPQNKRQRMERLAALADEERTMVLYEAPHKLCTTLQHLLQRFGPHRPLTICRELTKLHEEIWPTTLAEAAAHYQQNTPRGEFVLVLAGAPHPAGATATIPLREAARRGWLYAKTQRLSASEAAKLVAHETCHPKSLVYAEMQKIQNEPSEPED